MLTGFGQGCQQKRRRHESVLYRIYLSLYLSIYLPIYLSISIYLI